MKRVVILSVLLFVCFNLSAAKAKEVEIKVLSYNILHTQNEKVKGDKKWEKRRYAAYNMIKDVLPDIIGYQEATMPQRNDLKAALPEYGFIEQRGNSKFIMYRKDRFEFVKRGNFWMSDTPKKKSETWGGTGPRATMWILLRLKDNGREIYFFDTHLDVKSQDARLKGARLNVDSMKRICGKRAVQFIVGDMNSSDPSVTGIYETWVKDARKCAKITNKSRTYHGFGKSKNNLVIDYIYFRNAKPLSFELVDSKDYGVEYLSDHYPVLGRFLVK